VHSDSFDPSQNNVLGNLHSKAPHARDEHVGVLHALHGFMAQHIATQEQKAIRDMVTVSHPTQFCHQGGVCRDRDLQLSGIQPLVDLSIIAILSHTLQTENRGGGLLKLLPVLSLWKSISV